MHRVRLGLAGTILETEVREDLVASVVLRPFITQEAKDGATMECPIVFKNAMPECAIEMESEAARQPQRPLVCCACPDLDPVQIHLDESKAQNSVNGFLRESVAPMFLGQVVPDLGSPVVAIPFRDAD